MGRKRKDCTASSVDGGQCDVKAAVSKRLRSHKPQSREASSSPLKAHISGDDSSSPQSADGGLESPQAANGRPVDRKKAVHIRCERQRREAINCGYSELRDLLPSTHNVVGTKVTNASVLFRAADYIAKQECESADRRRSIDKLEAEAAALRVIARQYEAMQRATSHGDLDALPTDGPTGALGVSRLSLDCLFDAFESTVDTSSYDALARSMLTWLEQAEFQHAFTHAATRILRRRSTRSTAV